MHKYVYTYAHIHYIHYHNQSWMKYDTLLLYFEKEMGTGCGIALQGQNRHRQESQTSVAEFGNFVSRPSLRLKRSKATSSKTSVVIVSVVGCWHWRRYITATNWCENMSPAMDEQWVAALASLEGFWWSVSTVAAAADQNHSSTCKPAP